MDRPESTGSMSVRKWTIPDLIDFEYLLKSPSASDAREDRRIFLEVIGPRATGPQPWSLRQRRDALRVWLEERRALFRRHDGQAVLPGEVFRESRYLLLVLVGVSGLLSGGAVALPLLAYTGKSAVNVTLYLGVLVFLQVLGLLLMLRFFFLTVSMDRLRHRSLLYGLLGRLIERIGAAVARGAANRAGLLEASGPLRGLYGLYGQVFFWPFFGAVQLFGVMFNVGAISATLVRVLSTDLAFGWQSTLQMGPEAVHALVKVMAAPWAWLLGPHAYPSLAQIEGSRMVLKEGLTTLATGNLVSWWPFLVSAVACYGLLPRVLLWAAAAAGESRALARLRFTHAECDALILRMQPPGLSMQGVPEAAPPSSPLPQQPVDAEPVFLSLTDAAVLIPRDIREQAESGELDDHLVANLGLKPAAVLPVTGSVSRDGPLIEKALHGLRENERAVLLVQEAWLPPIAETMALIREIRSTGGRAMRITVLLVGKPVRGKFLTPVTPGDRAIWSKALAGLADPYLSVASGGEA
ncbi:MAG TPA: DUF2868 domain-containing protein [Deltaproteobacteria bacterium]|nr:DUF2868 domain-containing protein [Deltaproteobacteria bacterium]